MKLHGVAQHVTVGLGYLNSYECGHMNDVIVCVQRVVMKRIKGNTFL